MSKIIRALEKFTPLSEEDRSKILSISRTIKVNKGDLWLEQGKKNNDVAFIEEGYLRKYYLKDGEEITDSFYFEEDFCSDLPSIIGNTLPNASIAAMKNTTITIFSYYDFTELCKSSPALEHLLRVIVEFTFLRFYNRTISFILQTPKERYEELRSANPQVLQNAAQYHVASYLGITPQHLSRLRSEI